MGFNFNFTAAKLAQCIPGAPHVDQWFLAIQEILPDYNINTVERVACWLGQTAHESGGYRALRENLNYKAEGLVKIFPKYFRDVDPKAYAHNQEKIANRVYSNRMGNGDEASGDGFRYRGRGLIQLTGHDNYQAFADSIEEDIADIPAFLETYEGAVQSGCWFWESNNLNVLADKLDIKLMTKKINGGYIGLDDRIKHINHAIHVLGE
jgi:putative chitinase